MATSGDEGIGDVQERHAASDAAFVAVEGEDVWERQSGSYLLNAIKRMELCDEGGFLRNATGQLILRLIA